MEEKRKNLMKTGSSGWGGGPREDGGGLREDGGGSGQRRDTFLYFTKGVPSNWGPPVSTYGGGAVNF